MYPVLIRVGVALAIGAGLYFINKQNKENDHERIPEDVSDGDSISNDYQPGPGDQQNHGRSVTSKVKSKVKAKTKTKTKKKDSKNANGKNVSNDVRNDGGYNNGSEQGSVHSESSSPENVKKEKENDVKNNVNSESVDSDSDKSGNS